MKPLMRAKWVWKYRRQHAVMVCATAVAALMVLSKQETAPIVPAALWNISSMQDATNIPDNTENRYDLLVMLNESDTR